MSKQPRTRKYSKQSPQQKHATVKPKAKAVRYDPKLMAQHYDKNSRAMLWGIFAVLAVICFIYTMIGIDISGCSSSPDEDAYKTCRPYTILEYLANPDVANEESVFGSEGELPDDESAEEPEGQEEQQGAAPVDPGDKEK